MFFSQRLVTKLLFEESKALNGINFKISLGDYNPFPLRIYILNLLAIILKINLEAVESKVEADFFGLSMTFIGVDMRYPIVFLIILYYNRCNLMKVVDLDVDELQMKN